MKKLQITGLGPKRPDGSVTLFTVAEPYFATAAWLGEQKLAPETGDYLETDNEGNVTLYAEADVSKANAAAAATANAASEPAAKKKPDTSAGSGSGSKHSLGHFRGRPILVTAGAIVEVGEPAADGSRAITLEDGSVKTASPAMLSRITPQTGDYWVIQAQADGEYEYLNPKDVFERKYEPVTQ